MEQENQRRPSWLRRLAAQILPPATPQPEDRESIWSIYRRDARSLLDPSGDVQPQIAGGGFLLLIQRYENQAGHQLAEEESDRKMPQADGL